MRIFCFIMMIFSGLVTLGILEDVIYIKEDLITNITIYLIAFICILSTIFFSLAFFTIREK